ANLYAAYYIAELLNDLTDDYDPHPELFDAADEAVSLLARSQDVAPVVSRFELTALRLLGHLPTLDSCAECGKTVHEPGRTPFSQPAGGVLCKSCRVGQKHVISISRGVLDALVRLAQTNGEHAGEVALDRGVYGELRAVLNHYWSHLLGHEPRMHRY